MNGHHNVATAYKSTYKSWMLALSAKSASPNECCGIPLKPKAGLTPISCHAVLERSACAPFIKERRMECINATSLRRKSGQWGTQPSLLGRAPRRMQDL